MKGTVYRRAGARQDLVEIFRRLAREAGIRTADRFLATAEFTFQRLARMPNMGARYDAGNPAFGELRFFPLPSRFKKNIVFYRSVPDGIEIARVLHGACDLSAILAEKFRIGEANGDDEHAIRNIIFSIILLTIFFSLRYIDYQINGLNAFKLCDIGVPILILFSIIAYLVFKITPVG